MPHVTAFRKKSMPMIGDSVDKRDSSGVDKEAILPLKRTFDSLEDEKLRICFMYCCLYPEGFSIEVNELIQCWLAEDFLEKQQKLHESLKTGFALIEKLKESHLLETGAREGTVKMREVVRDHAMWIASSIENGDRLLVQSRKGLIQMPEANLWKCFRQVSFMNNKITRLPDTILSSSQVSTLLLQGNLSLRKIPENFFKGLTVLRVLNLSDTRIISLPQSVKHLKQLRALLLKNCYYLEKLPPVGEIKELEIFDLSNTCLTELPEGIRNLNNLKILNLSLTLCLEIIEEGTISSLSSLEQLDMFASGYQWDTKQHVAKGIATLDELGLLTKVSEIYIRVASINCLAVANLVWLKRMRKFQIFVGSGDFSNIPHGDHCERMLVIGGFDLLCGELVEALSNTSALVLDKCIRITSLFQHFAMDKVSSFTGLKSLTIADHSFKDYQKSKEAAPANQLPNLEELNLYRVGLRSILYLTENLGLRLCKLRKIEVTHCDSIAVLVPFNMNCQFECLEEIKVSFCCNMCVLIGVSMTDKCDILPRLRILELKNLQKLRTICNEITFWPYLERVEVRNCPKVMDLPLTPL